MSGHRASSCTAVARSRGRRHLATGSSALLMLFGALRAVGSFAAPPPTPAAVLPRPGDGAVWFTGLAGPIEAGTIPKWPVQLTPSLSARVFCLLGCSQWRQLDLALEHAAQWLAAFPDTALRFDAAMILAMTRQSIDSPSLHSAFERARSVADRDQDNPQRRFWTPDVTVTAEHTSSWPVPSGAGQRVNTNRVVAEALFCKENGWRADTMRYVCGPMRDDGGYQTTHALWALFLAHRNGCVSEADYEPCARNLQRELAARQPVPFEPKTTLDIDLYAERLQSSVLTGVPDLAVNDWANTLLLLQSPDGSWGISAAGEDPYYRYHATAVTTWALAEWYRRLAAYPETRAK